MDAFNNFITWSRGTFGLFMPLLIAPIWQEIVFRYLPFKYVPFANNHFWLVGLITSILYGLIHWYFGWAFVIATFVWGLILWYVVSKYGLFAVIILHAGVNLILITLGILNVTQK